MESHEEIEDQAAAFLAKRDSSDWTADDQVKLDQWLNESTARRVSMLRLEGVWEEARRLKALSAGLQAGIVPPPGAWRGSPFFDSQARINAAESKADSSPNSPLEPVFTAAAPCSLPPPAPPQNVAPAVILHRGSPATSSFRNWRRLAIAASIVVIVTGGLYFWSTGFFAGDRYATPVGSIASVSLRDGSNVTLNTATQLRVDLTPEARNIRLDRGEAFFEVAQDPRRPFVVQVGNKRVIAVGTKFSVRRNADDVRVVVTEGKVRVENSPMVFRAPDNRKSGAVFVTPGSIASAGDEGIVIEKKGLMEVEADLTWRRGYLTFHDTSLAEVVEEFNRYNTHKLTIDDPKLAAIRISGTFRPLNYEAFVRVLNDGFSIHAIDSEDVTTLTK